MDSIFGSLLTLKNNVKTRKWVTKVCSFFCYSVHLPLVNRPSWPCISVCTVRTQMGLLNVNSVTSIVRVGSWWPSTSKSIASNIRSACVSLANVWNGKHAFRDTTLTIRNSFTCHLKPQLWSTYIFIAWHHLFVLILNPVVVKKIIIYWRCLLQGELDDGSVNGDEDSADDGEITESSAGFNLRFSSDQGLSLEKQKRGVTSRKFCCEKCSYCSANKDNFRRHMSLHGSKQG